MRINATFLRASATPRPFFSVRTRSLLLMKKKTLRMDERPVILEARIDFRKMDKQAIFQRIKAHAAATSSAIRPAAPTPPRRTAHHPSAAGSHHLDPPLPSSTPCLAWDLAQPPTATTSAGGTPSTRGPPTHHHPPPVDSSPDLLF